MKKKLKGFYLLISSVFIYLLHLPFVFAKSATGNKLFLSADDPIKKSGRNSLNIPATPPSLYDSLHLEMTGLSKQAFEYAKKGFDKLLEQGRLVNDSILSIADFSQPSSQKRLYILDLKHFKVLFNTWVAHGRNSGREWADAVSNQPASYKSSPGFYLTRETYNGHNGYSLKLDGIEKDINDNAYRRAIVVHGAKYVDPAFVAARGYIGRSEGCPAIPVNMAGPIINTIKDGSCLFIYHPSVAYLSHSSILAS